MLRLLSLHSDAPTQGDRGLPGPDDCVVRDRVRPLVSVDGPSWRNSVGQSQGAPRVRIDRIRA